MSDKKDSSSLIDKLIERTFNSFPGGSDDWRLDVRLYARMLCVFTFGPMIHGALAATEMQDVLVYIITTLSVIGLLRITSVITRLVIALVDRFSRPKPMQSGNVS